MYNCTRNQFVDDLHFIPRGVVMKNRKFLISLLALNLAFGFTCPTHFYQNTAVISASAETMTPEEFQSYINQNEKKLTFDEVIALFKSYGYENYYIDTAPSGDKVIRYWWGLKKEGESFKYAESIKSGDFYYSLNDKNEAEIHGYDGLVDKLVIPETIDGHVVTALTGPYVGFMGFDKNDIFLGAGGGGASRFGGNYYYTDETHQISEIYLPFNCKIIEPTCIHVSCYYIFKDSAAEEHLSKFGPNFKYRDDISTDDETTDDETTDDETTDDETTDGETTDGETTDGETTADEYTTGDADGSGKIDVTDIAVTASHIKGIKALNAAGSKAADANRDGNVDVGDIAAMAAHIKDIKAI